MTRKVNTQKVLFMRARLYKGIYARVARELGVERSVVRRVAVGKGTSGRITKALIREMTRVERHIEKVVGDEDAA